jgi:hypothetical protein
MPDVSPQLREMVEAVAMALGPDLRRRTAFVGGVTTGLFVTDALAINDVRLTDDVDLIIDVVGFGQWAQLSEDLRARGFHNSPEGDVICRMRLDGLKVDFMRDDDNILGFINRWYRLGLATAEDHVLNDELTIRILTPPLFVATKLEAHLGRGGEDWMMSRDLEDILILLDGRRELRADVENAPREIQTYIAELFTALMAHEQLEIAVDANFRGDRGRNDLTYQRMAEIIALGS